MFLNLVIVTIIGLFAGGIVNALSDDLPHHRWPTRPHYPDGSPRPWLGILAFLTGQRASPGGAKLSWRYPVVEIVTPLMMIITVLVTDGEADVSSLQLVFYLFYMALFVLITVIDIEHRLILFAVIIPSCLIALADAILTPDNQRPDLGAALLGGALGFGVFFLLYVGGILFSYVVAKMRGYDLPEVAFGYGDVMLAALCGLILGWERLIFAMFITVFLGAFGALIYLVARSVSGKYNLFTPLPYGPYIVVGTYILLLFSDQVRNVIWAV
jgi:leader peptidase (prepilin peptidase)/N-methyltransferase